MNFPKFTQRIVIALGLVWLASGAWAAPLTYQLRVDGLACPFCAYGLEKKLGAVEGVQGLETNIKDGTLIVTMKNGATLDEASARQAVKEAGFSLRKFEPVPAAAQGSPGRQAK